jgi:hypothetical protein
MDSSEARSQTGRSAKIYVSSELHCTYISELLYQWLLEPLHPLLDLFRRFGGHVARRVLVSDDLRSIVLFSTPVDKAHIDLARPRVLHLLYLALSAVFVDVIRR